jgi:N-acetylmuramoyl-L-alanine amidase
MHRALAILAALLLTMSAKALPSHQEVVAAVLWAEARGEGYDGIHAVAEVIRNRTKHPKQWAATPFEVVIQPKQFSSLNDIDPEMLIARARASVAGDRRAWSYCLAVARQLERGTHSSNLTNGATHFCYRYARWSPGMEVVATIGRHTFYR